MKMRNAKKAVLGWLASVMAASPVLAEPELVYGKAIKTSYFTSETAYLITLIITCIGLLVLIIFLIKKFLLGKK